MRFCVRTFVSLFFACTAAGAGAQAAPPAPAPASAPQVFDAALAGQTGADKHGMRPYVFVLLKTGPNHMAAGPERDAMFAGHFANIERLAAAGKLVLAGPFDGVDGWRGMFVFAVASVDEARELVGTDPVIQHGEMVAEFHKYYGSAAVMLVPGLHDKLVREPF